MAAVRLGYFFGIFAFLSLFAQQFLTTNGQTQTAVLVPSTVELESLCSCDLTYNKCDINCCCDNECTAADRRAFSRCNDYFGVDNSQMCIRKKMIFISNSPFVINEESENTLFCVYTDNYLLRNSYYQPETVNTSFVFAIYMDRHDIGIWNTTIYPFTHNTSEAATYRSGDAILTVFNSGAIGLLSLPRSVNSGNCIDGNPAVYLLDQSFSCVRQLAALATSCQTSAELNAQTFYQNFQISPKPGMVNENVTSGLLEPMNPVLPVKCIDINGFEQNCEIVDSVPTPEYNSSTGICKNVLSELQYIITYDPNSNGTITAVSVNFKLREIKASEIPLMQTFKTKFISVNANASSTAQVKSGNPGYLVEKPVLAGKRVEQTIDGVTRVAVSLNSDPDTWLTMLSSSNTGACQDSSRLPISFGVDMRSGCTVDVDINNLTDSCQTLQDYAKNILLGQNPPDYVGRYGNTNTEKFGDWVPILVENDPPAAQGSSSQKGVCSNMVLGMHYQILYAKTGMLSNPQNKIIGVMRKFQQPQVLRFNCMGEFCQPNTLSLTQKVEISSSVSFIDVSEPAVPAEMERPVLAVRLPYDFFYPFLSGNGCNLDHNLIVMLAGLLATIVARLHY